MEYAYGKQTLSELAIRYKCSPKTIQRRLKEHQINQHKLTPKSVVLLIDTTYWKRHFGLMLFKDSISGDNLLKYLVSRETNALYLKGISELEKQGYRILAVICDGRRHLMQKLGKYPVQLCQYHQIKIIQRYLPNNAKHPSARDLRLITSMIPQITEMQLRDFLAQWLAKWQDYYDERIFNPETGKSQYTHRRLRSAYRSLMNNLPYLFTYQKYPNLGIPNTSNLIEGQFGHLKRLLGNHRGMNLTQKLKMIDEILGV